MTSKILSQTVIAGAKLSSVTPVIKIKSLNHRGHRGPQEKAYRPKSPLTDRSVGLNIFSSQLFGADSNFMQSG
jgi:hypothetical protein